MYVYSLAFFLFFGPLLSEGTISDVYLFNPLSQIKPNLRGYNFCEKEAKRSSDF